MAETTTRPPRDACNGCGESTAWGSGNYVNRIPADTSADDGSPLGGWLCAGCQCEPCEVCGEAVPWDDIEEFGASIRCEQCPEHDHCACIDCAAFIANGETPERYGEDEQRQWVAEFEQRNGGGWWVLGHGVTDFSWSPCQVCGSSLGGERFEAVFLPHESGN
jgi:hypothetical protein